MGSSTSYCCSQFPLQEKKAKPILPLVKGQNMLPLITNSSFSTICSVQVFHVLNYVSFQGNMGKYRLLLDEFTHLNVSSLCKAGRRSLAEQYRGSTTIKVH